MTILTAGIPLTISRKTAEFSIDKNKRETNKFVSAGLTVTALLSVIVVSVILIFKPLLIKIFADEQSYIVLLTLIPFLVSTALFAPIRGYMWGREQYTQASIVELIEQILKIILCVILFNVGISNPNIPAGLAISLSCILSSFVGFYYFKKDGGRICSHRGYIKPLVKIVAPLNAVRVAGSLLQPLVSIVLPLMMVKAGYTSNQALSQLGIVMGMTFPVVTIPTTLIGSLSMALVPKLSVLQRENKQAKLQKQIINSLSFTLFCCFLFLPIFSAIGVPICNFLFKNNDAGTYLQYFAWVVVPMGISQISTSILNSLGNEKFVFFSYAISAIFIVLSIFILPQFVGIYAIMIGMALQSSIVSVINLIKIKKLVEYRSQIPTFTKYIFVCLLVFFLTKWFYPILAIILTDFFAIAISSAIALISFIVLAYCFNIVNLEILTCKFKKKHTNCE